jgi:hypothetical protein
MVPYVRIDRSVGDKPAVKFTVNTVTEFEAILISASGDTNEEATALAKLEKLKQGSIFTPPLRLQHLQRNCGIHRPSIERVVGLRR